MLFMVIERFENNDALPVYRRLRQAGRGLPAGLTYHSSWMEPGFARCFQLMECDDPRLLQKWVLHWRGTGVTFEIVPVVEGAETAALVAPFLTEEDSSMRTHHAIDYIELAVRDVAEAKRFYAAAFGWSFTDYGPDYAGIHGAGGEVGGLRRDDEVRPGGSLVVLYSTDLEASVDAVRSAGGRIAQEPFSFPGGRRFHFLDPGGNELAVWSDDPKRKGE